jgi:hypothetical protein
MTRLSPEERREAQIRAIGQGGQFNELTEFGIEIFGATLDRLLAYFDANEPAVADAIRFGFRTPEQIDERFGQFWQDMIDGNPEEFIDYPEGHPKR